MRSTGGPSPQAATIFNIANQTVATVSSVGLVEAQQLGTTNLTGLVQAADPFKGQTVLHSKVTLPMFIYLLSIKFEVRSVKYRSTFYLLDLWPACFALTWSLNREGKTSICITERTKKTRSIRCLLYLSLWRKESISSLARILSNVKGRTVEYGLQN